MAKQFNLKVLVILSLGHMVTDIYQGALPAILPFLKERLSLTYTMTGFILMMTNFTSSILQPVFGYYSDKKEKAALLPLGLLCAGVGFSLLTLAPTYSLALFFVAISGLGIASYHPEGYKTAHFFTGDRSVTGMAIFSVGGNLGFSIGPILSIAIIEYLGYSALPVIVVPSLLCAALVISMRKTISVTRIQHTERQQARAEKTPFSSYVSLFVVICIVIMRSWTQIGLLTYIPFYYIDHLKGDAFYAGQLLFVFLFFGAVGTLLGSPFADRWGHRRFVRISMFLSTVTLPLIFVPFIQNSPLLFVVLGLQGIFLVSNFSVTIVMAQRLLPNRLGMASGLMTGFAIGAGGLGVTILGLVADNFGVLAALESIMILPFIGFILSIIVRYKE